MRAGEKIDEKLRGILFFLNFYGLFHEAIDSLKIFLIFFLTDFHGWLGQHEENELVFKIIAINCSGTIIIINYNFHHVYLRTGPDFTSSFSKIRPFKMDLGRL